MQRCMLQGTLMAPPWLCWGEGGGGGVCLSCLRALLCASRSRAAPTRCRFSGAAQAAPQPRLNDPWPARWWPPCPPPCRRFPGSRLRRGRQRDQLPKEQSWQPGATSNAAFRRLSHSITAHIRLQLHGHQITLEAHCKDAWCNRRQFCRKAADWHMRRQANYSI